MVLLACLIPSSSEMAAESAHSGPFLFRETFPVVSLFVIHPIKNSKKSESKIQIFP
jgi:hypothetical protein